jgi:anti-anti-sigma factor
VAVSPAVEFAPGSDDLLIDVSFPPGGSSAVVRVRGELDYLSAPDLGVLLDGIVGRGHRKVVLDLAHVSLLGAAGIRVIAAARDLAQGEGGELTIRTPSRQSRLVLAACSMSGLIRAEPQAAPTPVNGHAGVGSRSADEALRSPSPFSALLAMARSNDMIDAVLCAFTALTHDAVAGADGVSVTLARNGQMTTVGASNETIAQMDRDQYATGEGPCLAAAAEGQRFHIESLATEDRWPTFVPRAREDGIASILSTPLIVDGHPIGALNIYSSMERPFGAAEQTMASGFADHVSMILAETTITVADAELADRLRRALDAREAIALAQGVLMARTCITAEQAYAHLRHTARRTETTVHDQATRVLARVETAEAIA